MSEEQKPVEQAADEPAKVTGSPDKDKAAAARAAEAKYYKEREEKKKKLAKEDMHNPSAPLRKGEKFVLRRGKVLRIAKTASGTFSTYVGKEKDCKQLIKEYNLG